VIKADTVAHCGPTFQGEFTRTLTMTDLVTGWTENASIRNNASQRIAQTRSRPYKKNDQATVESKNNHVVRKHAFYWRYDTTAELALLGELWPLVSMRLNFFTPTKKPTGYPTNTDGRRTRLYDKPKTPWQRVQESGLLTAEQLRVAHARIARANPADLTRQINQIQLLLTELSRNKTETMTTSRHLNMASLEASIRRLQTTKKPQAPALTLREAPDQPSRSLLSEAPRISQGLFKVVLHR
jgi:hypothetical protein